jgi:hypothetical protein
MNREDTLNAFAIADAADGERLIDQAAAPGNHDTVKI